MFGSDQVDLRELEEAGRLARGAAAVWLGGWVVAFLLGALLMSGGGSGDVGMLGAGVAFAVVLVIGAATTTFSLRSAVRAVRLDGSSLLAKIAIGLNGLSTLYLLFILWTAVL